MILAAHGSSDKAPELYTVVAFSRHDLASSSGEFFLAQLAEALLLIESALPLGEAQDVIEVLFTNRFVAGESFDAFADQYAGDYFIYFFLNHHALHICRTLGQNLQPIGVIRGGELPPHGIGLRISPAAISNKRNPFDPSF